MSDKADLENSDNNPDAGKKSGRGPWIWRVLGMVCVFLVWLLYGGAISTTGAILAALLIGGGALMVWLSYRNREGPTP